MQRRAKLKDSFLRDRLLPLMAFLMMLTTIGFGPAARAVTADSALSAYSHILYGQLSMAPGGLAVGLSYEYPFHKTYGLGGTFYISPEDNGAAGVTLMGAFVRPHFHRSSWDFYVSPGVGIMLIDRASPAEDDTGLGPTLSYGLLYQMTDGFAFGLDHLFAYPWFADDDFAGRAVISNLQLSLRFGF